MEIDTDDLFKKPKYKSIRHKVQYAFERLRIKIKHLKYYIRDVFFPWNRIKVRNMDRSWHDRDYVIMHAMFTIFCDYIEGEQPFVDWDNKHKQKRHTNIAEMRAFVEKHYGKDAPVDEYGWSREEMDKKYLIDMELIWIYEWYVTGQWEFDYEKNGFSWEKEKEHDKKCDDMLHRLVAWRHHFWT